MFSEDDLEKMCIEWFRAEGWAYVHENEIAPDCGFMAERIDYREVFLRRRLVESLIKINPHIKDRNAFENAADALIKINEGVAIRTNRRAHELITSGCPVVVTVGDKKINEHVNYIDYQNPDKNDFLIVSQFSVKGRKDIRRPDLVAFVNGIPLAVIELKSAVSENADVWKAYNQIQNYKADIPDLFHSNVAVVISDGHTARVGSLTANKERMMPWRTRKNENDRPGDDGKLTFELQTIVDGFFDRHLFLDYVRYFVLFEDINGQPVKKIAGYHQFHAVRSAVESTLIASAQSGVAVEVVTEERATYGKEVQKGSRRAGVVWHTQGSGKSITMVCYAAKLLSHPQMQNPTLVVVTDRNDLDGQLYKTFCDAAGLLKQVPEQAQSRRELRDILSRREAGGIVFTTIQKFTALDEESEHPVLSQRANIVVISDEAHRSQYGMKGTLDDETGLYKYGFAKHMRDALPMASFIGFTGTPIATADKDTRAVFGDYVSIYDIQDAVTDGATVQIYYEGRLARLDFDNSKVSETVEEMEEILSEEDDEKAREKARQRWAQLRALVGAQPRLEAVAKDLVEHFENRTAALAGKAMVVCMSRQICVALYDEIVKLRPEWHHDDPQKGQIKIVMTGSSQDEPAIRRHVPNGQVRKDYEKRFKDFEDPLHMVLVCDMWLTGFDVPCCHTMYIDKPMKDHNLMQAIARVNRVFKDKTGGVVVDYIGIATDLKNALKIYTESKGRGKPTVDVQAAYRKLLEKLDVVRGLMHGFDYSKFETKAKDLILPVMNHLLRQEKIQGSEKSVKDIFMDAMLSVMKAYSICNGMQETKPLAKEIAFFSAVRTGIIKHTRVDTGIYQANRDALLKQLLDNSIVSDGIDDIFRLAGLDKPNIGLLSEEFLEDLKHMKQKNLAVALLEKLLNDEVKSRLKNNVVQERKFRERLNEALRKYHNRGIESAQVIEEMLALVEDIKKAVSRGEKLGLKPYELAFYDALADNESALIELGDENLKAIAVEVTEKLRKSVTVDWQMKDSVRAKMRTLIRRALMKHKYPPDKQPAAVDLVLKQAEVIADELVA